MTEIDTQDDTTEKRVALVTGSATRLGREIAMTLHGAGFDLCVHHHTSTGEATEFVNLLNSKRINSAFAIRQDLKDGNSASEIVSKLKTHRNRLDLLVNNASLFYKSSLSKNSIEDWDNMMICNARAPYYLSLSSAPLLRKNLGSIINISDIHGNRPRPDYSIYCASKAALNAVTQSLAIELAPEIRVNAVAPGAIIWADSEKKQERFEALQVTPLKRTGTPRDISGAVLYLAESSYVTGQILKIDGGRDLNI